MVKKDNKLKNSNNKEDVKVAIKTKEVQAKITKGNKIILLNFYRKLNQ